MFAERTPERNDLRIAKIAAVQFGAFSRKQALSAGFSVSQITRKLGSGRWEKMQRSVYALAGSSDSYDRRLMAVCLLGGLASHRSAGRLLGLLEFEGREVTMDRKNHASAGVILHVSALEQLERGFVRGIPCTDPTRTVIDLAQVLREEELERALDVALVRGMTSIPRLKWRLRVLGKRQGAARLRRLLDQRDPATAPTESDLEQRIEDGFSKPRIRGRCISIHRAATSSTSRIRIGCSRSSAMDGTTTAERPCVRRTSESRTS